MVNLSSFVCFVYFVVYFSMLVERYNWLSHKALRRLSEIVSGGPR